MREAELRTRCIKALDRNRNQRQANTLLLHLALHLRAEMIAASRRSMQASLSLRDDSLRRVRQSFCLLARSGNVLEAWNSDQG